MGVVVAQLIAQVAVQGAKEAEAQIAGVGKTLGITQDSMRMMALGGAAVAGAALVGLGAKAVQMAGNFQAGMTSLVTGAGESQKNIKMVSDGILKMAVDTGTSTKQLTDGMYMIESAGFHGAAGLQILKAAAEGAKVGSADLATVANGVTTAMTDYASTGLTASQATNTLIATVASGKTHMQDLSSAMSTILPTSAAVHVSFLDTSAALATMTGEGTNAASAATYLRQLLMALEAPASKGAKALKEIGLSTADVAAGMKISLPATLQMITDHLKKVYGDGTPAYVAALKDIAGGSKQMQGILELTGAHLQVFKDNVVGIGDAAKKGGQGITGWANVQADFNFKLDRAKEAVEVLMIKIGTGLLPVIGQILSAITPLILQFVNWITTGDRLKQFLDSSNPGMIALKIAIIALAGAVGGIMVAALVSMAVAAWAALVPLLPFIAVGAAVALVIAGIVLAVQHWGQITAWLRGIWGDVSTWFMGLLTNISNFIGGKVNEIRDGILKPFNLAKDAIGGILRFFVNGMIDMLNNGISGVENFINFFGQGLDTIAEKLGTKGTIPKLSLGRIPHYAEGTAGHPGGPAVVGERGRELVMLPRGASVLPNSQTEALLSLFGGSLPGYAGGIGDALGGFFNWVAGGAKSILDHVMSALHINLSLPGDLGNIASAIMARVQDWALGWINNILPKFTASGGGGGTPVNVPGSVASWIAAAMGATGVPGSWAGPLAIIAMHESGGNPNAQNNWDINAQHGDPSRGLFQTIGSTFAAYMMAGHGNILNPVDNAIAAIRYIESRYGSVFNVPGIVSMSRGGPYVGYADGTSYASGGWSWVGERGRELMYVPRGASILPNSQLGGAGGNGTVIQVDVYLDGQRMADKLMGPIVENIRYRVGTYGM